MEKEELYKYIGKTSWGGKAEHAILEVSIVKIEDIEYIKLAETYYDDYNVSTLMNKSNNLVKLGKDWIENKSIDELVTKINSNIDCCYKKFTVEDINDR